MASGGAFGVAAASAVPAVSPWTAMSAVAGPLIAGLGAAVPFHTQTPRLSGRSRVIVVDCRRGRGVRVTPETTLAILGVLGGSERFVGARSQPVGFDEARRPAPSRPRTPPQSRIRRNPERKCVRFYGFSPWSARQSGDSRQSARPGFSPTQPSAAADTRGVRRSRYRTGFTARCRRARAAGTVPVLPGGFINDAPTDSRFATCEAVKIFSRPMDICRRSSRMLSEIAG